MPILESIQRIEPTRITEPSLELSDLVAEIAAASTELSKSLHPKTASNLADLVRVANTYYSNLIEGHKTRPKDIERALKGDFDLDETRRNLQLEAAAHIRIQHEIDKLSASDKLPDPVQPDFLKFLHREFYKNTPKDLLRIKGSDKKTYFLKPGEWRSHLGQDVSVGRHLPPTSSRVSEFMEYFSKCYSQASLKGKTSQLMGMACAHHRFNYIHPFPDGNGRVSRLMSHAMAHQFGIGAQGLWSISRGLSRGLKDKTEYKLMMDLADTPRRNDLDGRGNLSQEALIKFSEWFLKVCLDQIQYMSSVFELKTLSVRMSKYVESLNTAKPEAVNRLLQEALIRGHFERGDIGRITLLPERTARRVLKELENHGLLKSDSPKGSLSLRFPTESLDILFPRLF